MFIPHYLSIRLGRKVETAGKRIISIIPRITAIKNGIACLATSSGDVSVALHAAYKVTPTGGVMFPIIRFATNIITKGIREIFIIATAGKNKGKHT